MADMTLINLNMLFMRYGEQVERELHVPLGCLYLTHALSDAGFDVDFRDYQCCPAGDPFDIDCFLDFIRDPAPVVGLSCMANLLPFTLLAARAIRQRYPDRVIVLGGVGATAVEDKLLRLFPWIDIIARGEGERTGPELLAALKKGRDLSGIAGISYRNAGTVVHNPERTRIDNIDTIPLPAFERIDMPRYAGYGMMTSRGCPYPCTFCSVAPIWGLQSRSRSPRSIVEEMRHLHHEAGVNLFLFQDEFFVSGKQHVMDFCRELTSSGLPVEWKAFGRVNLTDNDMMRAMADCGCLELRFGIESGSDAVLSRIRKGFTAAEVLDLIPRAVEILPRVDCFYVWGFPFETMDDFNQSLFQMVSFRMMGARILPSLLSLLPQTAIYQEYSTAHLEFCPHLFPEFVFTGHEVLEAGEVRLPNQHAEYFQLIAAHPDVFPGFFHFDLAGNVMPKLRLLRQFGFYPDPNAAPARGESCGAHSPRSQSANLTMRTDT